MSREGGDTTADLGTNDRPLVLAWASGKGNKRPIVLCATGIEALEGGIANANRNVALALGQLAHEFGLPTKKLTLLEPRTNQPDKLAFGGDKFRFGAAVLSALVNARMVVFDHTNIAVPFLALPASLRAPVVILGHGSEVGRRMRPLGRRALISADLVLAVSEHTLRAMRRELKRDDIGVVCSLGLPPHLELTLRPPSEVEVGTARSGLELEAADGARRPVGQRMVLLVGRLDADEREKGHRELIGALPAIREQVPEAQCVFVGGGSDEDALRRLAATSPAASAIFLTGRAPQALLQQLYLAAYAYVMPSRQEGFGLVYLEAMNYALPCIACRNDGGAEVVVDGETGLLVGQPVDERELADAVIALLSNPDRARALGIAGWRRLNAEFTAAAHQARVVAALRPLLT
jgi:phosphatidylinositol alpha-1,6-mannosyltransferase